MHFSQMPVWWLTRDAVDLRKASLRIVVPGFSPAGMAGQGANPICMEAL